MTSPINVLNSAIDTSAFHRLVHDGVFYRAVPFAEVNKFQQEVISLYCHKQAIYQIVTTELVDWLISEIGEDYPNKVLEIGSGCGWLTFAMAIHGTDNFLQTRKEVKLMYALTGQPTITYPRFIERMGGNKAVETYKPNVVLASWVTQLFKDGKTEDGNMYGVDETLFKGKVKKYIMIGNEKTHDSKEILKLFPCQKYKFPWLVSRSMSRENNCIYVFDCR